MDLDNFIQKNIISNKKASEIVLLNFNISNGYNCSILYYGDVVRFTGVIFGNENDYNNIDIISFLANGVNIEINKKILDEFVTFNNNIMYFNVHNIFGVIYIPGWN